MLLQGSGYELPVRIEDCEGNPITKDMVKKASFTFGNITKNYGEESDEVTYKNGAWIVPLTEDETFSLKGTIQWQARFLFNNGLPDGTVPMNEYVYDSINKTKLSGGGEDA